MIALATPLAMAFPVVGTLSAGASTGIVAPQNGSVITSGSQVSVRAHYDFAFQMQLRAKIPGSGDSFLTSGGVFDHSLSAPLSLNRNGRYTVYLKGSQTGHVYASSSFTVRIAPAAPSGVSASVSGGKIRVSWNLGYEDDLTGYSVSASGAGSTSGSVSSLCSGSSCSASIPVGSGSGSVSVQVQARRSNGLGGSVSSSPASTTVSVGGGGGGGGNGGPNTSVPPGTTNPGGGGTNGNTPLTPFNNQSPVTLPSVQPSDATPGFAYPTPQVASNQSSPKAMNAAASTQLAWGRSIGIALILLVVAAHLGTWTRRLRTAQAGVSEKGMAARLARSGSGRSRVRKAQQHIAQAEAMAKTAVLTPAADGSSAAPLAGAATAGTATAVDAMPGAALGVAGRDASKNANGMPGVVQGAAANPSGARRSSRRPARLGKRPGNADGRVADKGNSAGGRPAGPLSSDPTRKLPSGPAGTSATGPATDGSVASAAKPTAPVPGLPADPTPGASAPTASAPQSPTAGVPGVSKGGLFDGPVTSAAAGTADKASNGPTADAPRPSGGQGTPDAGTRPRVQHNIFSIESAVAGIPDAPTASAQDEAASDANTKGRRSGRGRRRKK
ncbi:hypothetical protein [Actinomadura gamaensis]|uniref:Fibronectin type-III domain-containing protein n=1 Tax=Actinomadura gamaensis TaxID=1763541 RepID=A0ABV9TXS4_9ACTN